MLWKNSCVSLNTGVLKFSSFFRLKYLTQFETTVVCRHLAISLAVFAVVCYVKLGSREEHV